MRLPALPGFDPATFEKHLKNTGWLMLARVGSMFLKMLVTAVALTNYLGSGQNGILNYPLVFMTFFVAISGLGLDTFVTRQLLTDPANRRNILGTAWGMRILSGLIMIPLIFGTYFILQSFLAHPPAAPVEYIAIASLICVFQSVHIIDNYFQAQAQGKSIMWVQVGANLLSTLIKAALILTKAPLVAFIWMLSGDILILSVGYILVYQKQVGDLRLWRFDRQLAGELFKKSWPLAFSALFVTLYMKIDQLMIDAYLGKQALGIYSPAVNLSEAWYFVPVAIVTSLFPAIMHIRASNPQKYKQRLQNLYDLMVGISVAVALVTTLAAPWIFEFLYKPEFREGAQVLTIHIWAGVFIALNLANGQFLLAEGMTGLMLLRSLLGAMINIALNILWIPDFGMAGAAYATVVAYASSAMFVIFVPKTREQAWMMIQSLLLFPLLIRLLRR